MTKQVQISRKADKVLGKLASNTAKLIIGKIRTLADNPASLVNNIKKLQGENDLYRLRVGNYRIIYTDDLEILYIWDIGPRGKIYK